MKRYPDATIPDAEDILVTDWKNDPLYLGSAPKLYEQQTVHNILAAPVGRLFFSGDGIDKVYSGQLHGTYYSGVNAGLTIANAMETNIVYKLASKVVSVLPLALYHFH